jgi:mercuric ion binding protein
MKIRAFPTFTLAFLFYFLTAKASHAQSSQIAIKSSVICEMCAKKVKRALAFKGVEKTTVDLNTQVINVTYDPQQTSPENIRSAISKAGYDADEVKADPKAYRKLDKCCKKENLQH